jgi:hypothetical protein
VDEGVVGAADAAGGHLDTDLARARPGSVDVDQRQRGIDGSYLNSAV